MDKAKEKPIKILLCGVLGMGLSILLGHPYSITVPVTAILVAGAGMNTSWRGTRRYCLRRLAVQLVDTAVLAGPLILAREVLGLSIYAALILTCTVPMALALYLDYRLGISPMYATSVSVSGLIIITGTAQMQHYVLTRFMLVCLGCIIGFAVSSVLMPGNYCKAALEQVEKTLVGMTALAEEMARGRKTTVPMAEYLEKINESWTDVSAYRTEFRRYRYRRQRVSVQALQCLWETQPALLCLLDEWARHIEDGPQTAFSASYGEAVLFVLERHSALLGEMRGVQNNMASAAGCTLPAATGATEKQIAMAGYLAAYRGRVWDLAEQLGRRKAGE